MRTLVFGIWGMFSKRRKGLTHILQSVKGQNCKDIDKIARIDMRTRTHTHTHIYIIHAIEQVIYSRLYI